MLTFFNELPTGALQDLFADGHVAEFLASGGHALSMGMVDLTPERAGIVRDLEGRDIPVTAWLLLDRRDGYWFNADNFAAAAQRLRETLRWARDEGLSLHRVGLDIESPRDEVADLSRSPGRTAWRLLLHRREAARVVESEENYRRLIDEIHDSGRSVETYQVPFVVDERLAGSTLLRRTFGLLDLPADVEVLMAYETYLGESLAASYFGQAGGIGVGVTGGGVNAGDEREERRLLRLEPLLRQCRAAHRAGSRVYVFSLEGCVWNGMLAALSDFDFTSDDDSAMPSTTGGNAFRRILRLVMRSETLVDALVPRRARS